MVTISNSKKKTVAEVLRISKHHIEPNSEHSMASFDCFSLIYVIKGSIRIHNKDDLYTISENQLIILNIDKAIDFFSAHPETTDIVTIQFEVPTIQLDTILNQRFSLDTREQHLLFSLYDDFQKITLIKKNKPSITYDKEIAELFNLLNQLSVSTLSEILLLLCQKLAIKKIPTSLQKSLNTLSDGMSVDKKAKNLTSPSSSQVEGIYKNQLVTQIIIFMENNLDKNFSIDEIAQEFLVGSANLKKIFKKETGYSIMAYFKNLKMKKAQEWIRENQLSYTEIAEKLNFNSIHHFSAAFKKHTGYAPSKYFDTFQPGYVEELKDVDYIINQRPWST